MPTLAQRKSEVSLRSNPNTRDIAKAAAADYFKPFSILTSYLLWAIGSSGGGSKGISPSRNEHPYRVFKKAISYNQGTLIEYLFLSAEKHKALRVALGGKTPKTSVVKELVTDFLQFLNQRFFEVTFHNFEFLREHFEQRTSSPPRICIKGNFIIDNDNTIVSIVRDSSVNYNSDVKIEGNTGFLHVKDTGNYYIENNIPRAAAIGRYVNPRLNRGKIAQDAAILRNVNGQFILSFWDKYWTDFDANKTGDASYYKSTLVVPISLRNSSLTEEFREAIKSKTTDIENIEDYIFGYLCMDHRDIGFFDEESDVDIGYVFADILSVYLFSRMVYTDLSRTYSRLKGFLEDKNEPISVDKLDDAKLDALIRNVNLAGRNAEPESTGTKRNKLMPVDDALLTSVRPDIKSGAEAE